ncbi:MAG: hypothetical protein HYT79_01735 [Elusimicrobia bacterium]|nr:hypothetical protein [Elusimicrobiota bacterium]
MKRSFAAVLAAVLFVPALCGTVLADDFEKIRLTFDDGQGGILQADSGGGTPNQSKKKQNPRRRERRPDPPPNQTPAQTGGSVVRDVSPDDVDAVIQNSTAAFVVTFYSPTCPHCHSFLPLLEEVARDYQGRVLFFKINVDSHSISGPVPTTLFVRPDRKVAVLEGTHPDPDVVKTTLRDTIDNFVLAPNPPSNGQQNGGQNQMQPHVAPNPGARPGRIDL